MSKEKPILFSGEMVRAILDGRKTKTRRVIKPQPDEKTREFSSELVTEAWLAGEIPVKCPFGQPGHRLWVRESCWAYSGLEPFPSGFVVPPNPHMQHFYGYDDHPELQLMKDKAIVFRVPSIHMPRWASRITLEITKIRVERVQEITNEDAIAEGIAVRDGDLMSPKEYFEVLWDKINAKRGFGWDENPWVWVIEFRRLTL